jgi:outer membrane protein OmpA-like peptidoglycan-associated protein
VTKWPLVSVVALLTSCAQVPDRVVLLPNADGRSSAVIVTTAKGEVKLATPYATVQVKGGVAYAGASGREEVQGRYGPLLDAQPERARSFVVYFFFESAELTPASRPLVDQIKTEIASMPAVEVFITGHTDTVGPDSINEALSLRRAEAVRDALVKLGIPPESIQVAGFGDRKPALRTAPEVPEPKNRRAEINVR